MKTNTQTFAGAFLIFIFIMSVLQSRAQVITQAEKVTVIDTLALKLDNNYVFPDIAAEMSALLKTNLAKGDYYELNDAREFAMKLTEDIRIPNGDRHLRVGFDPEGIARRKKQDEQNDGSLDAYFAALDRADNYGFKELKIMPGNVGYLLFTSFQESEDAFRTAVSVMNFFSNTDALIIDLRENGGGSPIMIQLLSSYLLDGYETHLNSFFSRPADETRQFWTLPYVPGKKITDIPVYILTSQQTFSAAEEFTYNLKNLKRATIVGETTGGGAHPTTTMLINDNFVVSIPIARAVNPITKTNWEGTGIEPDIKVTSEKAMEAAYADALAKVAENAEIPEIKKRVEWVRDNTAAMANPFVIDSKTMKAYTGKYGPRNISSRNGELFYQREDRPEYKMTAMSEDTFMFEKIDYFRLRIIKEGNKIIAVEGIYDDGRTDRNERD